MCLDSRRVFRGSIKCVQKTSVAVQSDPERERQVHAHCQGVFLMSEVHAHSRRRTLPAARALCFRRRPDARSVCMVLQASGRMAYGSLRRAQDGWIGADGLGLRAYACGLWRRDQDGWIGAEG